MGQFMENCFFFKLKSFGNEIKSVVNDVFKQYSSQPAQYAHYQTKNKNKLPGTDVPGSPKRDT